MKTGYSAVLMVAVIALLVMIAPVYAADSNIGIYTNGTWYLDFNGNGAWDGTPTDGLYSFGGGLTGAVPVTGDWTGTGTAKIGIYANGVWYLDLNGNGQWDGTPTDAMYYFGGGLTGAVPVTGKWVATWAGTAVDQETGNGVPNVTVTVRAADGTNDTLSTTTTNSIGAFTANVPVDTPAYLNFVTAGYANKNTEVKTLSGPITNSSSTELIEDSLALVQAVGQYGTATTWSDSCISSQEWLSFGASTSGGSNAAGVTITSSPTGTTGPYIWYNNSTVSTSPSYTTGVGTSTPSSTHSFPAAFGYNISSTIGSYVFTAVSGTTSLKATVILNPGEIGSHTFKGF